MSAEATIRECASAAFLAEIRRELEHRKPDTGDRLDEICRYALLSPGKLLRPLLLVTSAEAVGGTRQDVLPAALAVEYLHAASLVHDDIIDGDDLRRGRASVHSRYGVPDAIVTGDALMLGLFGAIADCAAPDSAIVAAVRVLAKAGEDLCRGQIRESLLVPPGHGVAGSGLEDYLAMATLKTGALFRAACRSGALLAGGSPAEVDALTAFAEHAGLAFQMYDDLLPFLAEPAATGKPGTSDAANLRPTYPVLLAHREGSLATRHAVERALSGELRPQAAHVMLREAVMSSGALDLAVAGAREEAHLAKTGLSVLPGARAAGVLAAIADLAVDRDR